MLIDYGTGYFVERNTKQSVGFCERKLSLIKENTDQLFNTINQRKKTLDAITLEMQRKIQQQQLQQQQQQQPQIQQQQKK